MNHLKNNLYKFRQLFHTFWCVYSSGSHAVWFIWLSKYLQQWWMQCMDNYVNFFPKSPTFYKHLWKLFEFIIMDQKLSTKTELCFSRYPSKPWVCNKVNVITSFASIAQQMFFMNNICSDWQKNLCKGPCSVICVVWVVTKMLKIQAKKSVFQMGLNLIHYIQMLYAKFLQALNDMIIVLLLNRLNAQSPSQSGNIL